MGQFMIGNHLSGFTLPLRDGSLVDIRPVRPDDRKTLQNGMSDLSHQSRYFRFFNPKAQLSAAQLDYFTEVDQQDHVAWIALARNQPGQAGLGIARFIRLPAQPDIAEFAIVVVDRHHRRGLGSMLLAALYKTAMQQGIKTLRGFVLPENTVMSHWLGSLGAAGEYENGICRLDLVVDSDFSGLPDTPTGKRFRECVDSTSSF